MSTENINPDHYKGNKLECIDCIEEATRNLIGIEAITVANVIKYIWRYKDKNGLEDLLKAEWYLKRLINHNATDEVIRKTKDEIMLDMQLQDLHDED